MARRRPGVLEDDSHPGVLPAEPVALPRWYEWALRPERHQRPGWSGRRRALAALAVLVWLVVVLTPSVLAARQGAFYLAHPTQVVSARLAHCAQDECVASYEVRGRRYTADGLPGSDGARVSLAVDRDHPASWRTRGVTVYVVAVLAWLVVGLPGILVVVAARRASSR